MWTSHVKVRPGCAGIVTNEPEKRVFGVATSTEALARIQGEFRRVLSQAMPGRPLPF